MEYHNESPHIVQLICTNKNGDEKKNKEKGMDVKKKFH
jgi:hypothetical protein